MRRRRRASIEDLRLAIQCLPAHTRRAMLTGIRANEIIVGGYTDGAGGICPMLAAHRAGGRTNFHSFARAWDRFAQVESRTRRATERELRILTTHLEASLLDDDGPSADLAQAVREHRELIARKSGRVVASIDTDKARPGDRDRSRELRDRPGWAWMRLFRRYDDYERAVARVLAQSAAAEADRDAREPAASR